MTAKRWLSIVIPAGLLFGLALGWATATTPVEPRFKASPNGWLPSCPAGMDLIRHDPKPDCYWGVTREMSQKPTQGDMECVYAAQATALPACPKE